MSSGWMYNPLPTEVTTYLADEYRESFGDLGHCRRGLPCPWVCGKCPVQTPFLFLKRCTGTSRDIGHPPFPPPYFIPQKLGVFGM